MPSTTRNDFNTVSQAGAGTTWVDISNLAYPESGYAYAEMSASDTTTNKISLGLHEGMSGVPTGATFESMSFKHYQKKTGIASSGADVDVYGDTNLSSGTVWSRLNIADETWDFSFSSGDRTYWKLTAYTPADIITKLKDGTLELRIWFKESNGVAVQVQTDLLTLTVTYATVEGKRGAVLIPLT